MSATIELTYGCNLRCAHCYNPTHKAKGELKREELYRILDGLKEEGCLWVTFTGGEMFTRPDVFDILGYAGKLGLVLIFYSNAAAITPQRAERIKALRPMRVEVSLYGATQQTYEAVTGIKGSYSAFLRGVSLLRERRIPLLVKMPVMTLNRHEVAEASDLVSGWGVKFQYCADILPGQDGSRQPLRYRLSPQQVLSLDLAMTGAGSAASELKECRAAEGLFSCPCGRSSLAVTPYGEMNLCVNFPVPRYDLRRGSVAGGWEVLKAFVDAARPDPSFECPRCPLNAYCRRGAADAWRETGDLNACLPYYKELAGLEKQAAELRPEA